MTLTNTLATVRGWNKPFHKDIWTTQIRLNYGLP